MKHSEVKEDFKSPYTMSCPVKFMEHLVKTRTNEFIPHHEIQQIHNQVIQKQKHLEIEKDIGWV